MVLTVVSEQCDLGDSSPIEQQTWNICLPLGAGVACTCAMYEARVSGWGQDRCRFPGQAMAGIAEFFVF
jgi:hypothetical protein